MSIQNLEVARSFDLRGKQLLIVGSLAKPEVADLRGTIEKWGATVIENAASNISALLAKRTGVCIACFTDQAIDTLTWQLLNASLHDQIKLLPVIFPGGALPPVICGTTPANMSQGVVALNKLGMALERFLK